jgi:hypothetical protein
VAFSVALFEVTFEVMNLPPFPYHLPEGIFAPDPENGFIFKANTEDYESAPEYKIPIKINSLGLRDNKSLSRTDEVNMIVLGDSFAQGTGVELKDAISTHLSNELSVVTANFGHSSYGTRETLSFFRRNASQFESRPKMAVLLFYSGNDFFDNLRTKNGPVHQVVDGHRISSGTEIAKVEKKSNKLFFRDGQGKIIRETLIADYSPNFKIGLPVIEQTRSFMLISKSLKGFFLSTSKKCQLPIAIPGFNERVFQFEQDPAFLETTDLLDELKSLTESLNMRLLVVLLPSKYQAHPDVFITKECRVEGNGQTSRSHEAMMRFLLERKIPSLDLLPDLAQLSESEAKQLWYREDTHLRPAGARFVAKKIASYLKQSGLQSSR